MTTRRRSSGEGTVYYDETAERWVGQIDAGRTDTGKRRRRKVSGRTRKEAVDKLRDLRKQMEAGDRAPATMTVGDLLDEWSAAVITTMTPNTAQQYRWSLGHLRAGLGHHRLVDLRAHHVEQVLRAKADSGMGHSSVSRLRSNLARVLRWAERRDLVARNHAELADLPETRPPKEGRSLTVDELGRLLNAARGRRTEALWIVLAGAGLRPGEALGLQWRDLDLDAGIVHVRQALKPRQGGPVLGPLKTGRSRRSLAVPPAVVAALRAHRTRWTSERLAGLWPTEWVDLVFVTELGNPLNMSNVREDLNTVAKVADVGHVRPYDLRHTCASLLADAGVPLERVADYLGHDGTRMARTVYIHALTPTVEVPPSALGAALGDR
ncbi:MAG TPA: site-specific integrase [Iamia sp.]|nr:site-specific integrase [Iamia sp.]